MNRKPSEISPSNIYTVKISTQTKLKLSAMYTRIWADTMDMESKRIFGYLKKFVYAWTKKIFITTLEFASLRKQRKLSESTLILQLIMNIGQNWKRRNTSKII